MNDAMQQFSSAKDHLTRGHFDMIVTFPQESQAREALAELRTAGFGPDQALLLYPEESGSPGNRTSLDGLIKFSPDELVTDAVIAHWIIICVEFVVGALAGAVVGWIVALFLNAPAISPVWFWMLILGAAGAVAGVALGSLEWKKWQRQTEALRQQVAIGLRFKGRNQGPEVTQARSILEQHGGLGIDNT
jgi:hypothetical protein